MRRALLDVNVLLALLDADHVDHVRATDRLDAEISGGWASCALTENGFVRILSQPRYPSPVAPAEAVALLARACSGEHHAFWSCDVSLLDPASSTATGSTVPGRSPTPTCSPWPSPTTAASWPSTGRCPSPRSSGRPRTT